VVGSYESALKKWVGRLRPGVEARGYDGYGGKTVGYGRMGYSPSKHGGISL